MDVRQRHCVACRLLRSPGRGALTPQHCACLLDSPPGQCHCGRGFYLDGTGVGATCKPCPNGRNTPNRAATHVRECSLCPVNTYGLGAHTAPCRSCGYKTTNGAEGQTSEQACVTCVGQLCSTGLAAISGAIMLLLVLSCIRYCVVNLPLHPRLPPVRRDGFLLGISNYTNYAALPGAIEDLNSMYAALLSVGFNVSVFNNVGYAKDLAGVSRDGNVMQVFSEWCDGLKERGDVMVYYGGHGIHFQGMQWLVPARARVNTGLQVLYQCVQFDWLRITLARRSPRVSIFALDCCDAAIGDTFVKKSNWRNAASNLPEGYKLVDVRELHESKRALNVYIFHGAATATKAKEYNVGGRSAGAFTTAFLRHIHTPNLSLDDLSEFIRSDMLRMTKDSREDDEGAIPKVPREAATERSTEPQLSRARSVSVQISPTENYLQHEFRGWCFKSSEPMCCGLVTPEVENNMRWLIRSGTCSTHTESSDDSIESTAERSINENTNDVDRSTELAAIPSSNDQKEAVEHTAARLNVERAAIDTGWSKHTDKEGRDYYYNAVTRQSTWTQHSAKEEGLSI